MKIISVFLKVITIGIWMVACSPEPATNLETSISADVAFQETLESTIALGFDAIPPIYGPVLIPAAEDVHRLTDDELVMGVTWEGEAKAYPVTVLRFREMVNDELAGIPILVTGDHVNAGN